MLVSTSNKMCNIGIKKNQKTKQNHKEILKENQTKTNHQ